MRVILYLAHQDLSIKNKRMPRNLRFIQFFEVSHTHGRPLGCMCEKGDLIVEKIDKSKPVSASIMSICDL